MKINPFHKSSSRKRQRRRRSLNVSLRVRMPGEQYFDIGFFRFRSGKGKNHGVRLTKLLSIFYRLGYVRSAKDKVSKCC
jgi:hypothetical protein